MGMLQEMPEGTYDSKIAVIYKEKEYSKHTKTFEELASPNTEIFLRKKYVLRLIFKIL